MKAACWPHDAITIPVTRSKEASTCMAVGLVAEGQLHWTVDVPVYEFR